MLAIQSNNSFSGFNAVETQTVCYCCKWGKDSEGTYCVDTCCISVPKEGAAAQALMQANRRWQLARKASVATARATAARRMFGLGADGALMQATITQTVAERVQAIRNKMVTLGVPIAVGSGAITMLTFAAAFGLARTERVWAPALWLGAMTTVGGLITAAVAAKTAADEAKKQAETPTTVTPPVAPVTPTPVTPTPTPPDTVSTFGYYGGYGYGYY